jgi:hypothetical protein
MPFDFTLKIFGQLLVDLQRQGYSFQPFVEHLEKPKEKVAILRHDVDLDPYKSLKTSQIEYELSIKGSYYFRILPESFNETVINQIAQKGHEIGYHYEDLPRAKGDMNKAYDSFCKNLETFRKIYPIKTICMHGSPMSKFDSRNLWKKFDYHSLGIIGEPYFDVNFNEIFYLTDTGRRWDGRRVSIRDKALVEEGYKEWKVKPVSGSLMSMSQKSIDFQNKFEFRSTQDIIMAAEKGELSNKILMTFHPQRWTDEVFPWVKELVWQNVKNAGKYFLIKVRG